MWNHVHLVILYRSLYGYKVFGQIECRNTSHCHAFQVDYQYRLLLYPIQLLTATRSETFSISNDNNILLPACAKQPAKCPISRLASFTISQMESILLVNLNRSVRRVANEWVACSPVVQRSMRFSNETWMVPVTGWRHGMTSHARGHTWCEGRSGWGRKLKFVAQEFSVELWQDFTPANHGLLVCKCEREICRRVILWVSGSSHKRSLEADFNTLSKSQLWVKFKLLTRQFSKRLWTHLVLISTRIYFRHNQNSQTAV